MQEERDVDNRKNTFGKKRKGERGKYGYGEKHGLSFKKLFSQ
jgi:hypothetical protein